MEPQNPPRGDHSLNPDFFTGWKPNSALSTFKQLPIYFTNPYADILSKTLTSFGSPNKYRVVYMGPRHTSNLKVFKTYARNADNKIDINEDNLYGQSFQKYEFKYSQVKQKAFPIKSMQYRLFSGMNPTLKKEDVRFDADFQCGNLDLAILINSLQYDLIMRVDSNTKGHTSWFYFKVSNFNDKHKILFNLINFQKDGLLYKEGMKPYCYRSSKRVWEQSGSNIEFRPKCVRYNLQNQQNSLIMNSLSFIYEFDKQDQYVYFAYCVPYSYSYLMHRVQQIHKENPHYVHLDCSNLSTGGLPIPVLTISNSNSISNKPVCFAIGRLHPGQTQGSWVMDGFLKFICSPQGYFLRQRILFKIIPMVNVDGVILGNFRTGIFGRDLNRVFTSPQKFTEIAMVRALAYKFNPLIFLDFHGHSGKKNVFTYGPNYGVDHRNYFTSRILPKLISKATNAFRYYACLFKISQTKINTARSIMLRNHGVQYVYTIESSSFAYGRRNQQVKFTRLEYQTIGEKIAESIIDFFKITILIKKKVQEIKNQSLITNKNQSQKSQLKQDTNKQDLNQKSINQLSFDIINNQANSQFKLMFMELIQERTQDANNKSQDKQKYDTKPDSDFQQGNDYSDKQLKNMFKVFQDSDKSQKQQIKHKKKKSNSPKKGQHKLITEKNESNRKSPNVIKPMQFQLSKRIISVEKNQRSNSPASLKYSDKSDIFKSRNLVNLQIMPSIIQNMNKVHYNNWKKISVNPVDAKNNFCKAHSVNHIDIDYESVKFLTLQSQITETNESQKKDERQLKGLIINQIKQRLYREKKTLFPSIHKNSETQRRIKCPVIDEIFANYDKNQKDTSRKNLKIVYY